MPLARDYARTVRTSAPDPGPAAGAPQTARPDAVSVIHFSGMKVDIRRVGDIPVLCPEGRITIGPPSIALKAALDLELKQGATKILFDGSRVEYLDSSGLAELISAARTLSERGGRLAVSSPSHKLREVLEITGLERVFLVGDDEGSLLKELAKLTG